MTDRLYNVLHNAFSPSFCPAKMAAPNARGWRWAIKQLVPERMVLREKSVTEEKRYISPWGYEQLPAAFLLG